MSKPQVNSSSQKELEKVDAQFQAFDEQVQSMTLDRMNAAPKQEEEPQTKISTREANKMDAPYIKPIKSMMSREPFNEKYRAQHTEAWKYVKCIVENYELIGEQVELWTKRFAGDPAHFWKIPVNKPVYIPKLVAEQLSQCRYHRLTMEASNHQVAGTDGFGTYLGNMVVDTVKNRIDAKPVGFGFMSTSI